MKADVHFLRDFMPPDFYERALCAEVDPELFFPERGGSTREAKKVCAACEVRDQCRTYALDTAEQWGVWGGESERERLKIRRDARAAEREAS